MMAILMAVYNGERHIRQQLDSILDGIRVFQVAFPKETVRLFISDDGSEDATPEIVEEYAGRYPGILEVCSRSKESSPKRNASKRAAQGAGGRGPAANFFFLLREAGRRKDISVCLFADQDDVWLPEKPVRNYRRIREAESRFGEECPLLLHSDALITDSLLNPLPGTMHTRSRLRVHKGLPSLLVENVVTGNTMACNGALLSLFVPPQRAVMHDWWLALTAKVFGRLLYDSTPLVLYRQHGSNTLGAERGFLLWRYFSKKERQRIQNNYWLLYRQAESLYRAYAPLLKREGKKAALRAVKVFIRMEGGGRLTKAACCLRFGFVKSSPLLTLGQLFRI